MDVNKPVTNKALLDAIHEMQKDSSKEELFFKELVETKFLCPAKSILQEGLSDLNRDIRIGQDSRICLISIEDKKSRHFLAAFTDWNEVKKWKENEELQAVIMPYEDYRKMICNDSTPYAGMVINPYSENIVLTREVLQNIYAKEVKISAGNKVMVGIPKEYPTDMVEELKRKLRTFPDIRSAYLLWMVREKTGSYLLILDAGGKEQRWFPVIERICIPYLRGKILDMTTVNSSFAQAVIKDQKPFYCKNQKR
ncbi:MAG: enhanced serine sensitivity protein SseB C-terminal domain-containing protein [Mediterraneibacter sp.]